MLKFKAAPVKNVLKPFKERLSDMSPALTQFLPRFAASIRTNFEIGGRPGWAPLSERYASRKQKQGYPQKTLVRTGALRDSSQFSIDKLSISVSSALPYASAHQYGAASKNLPARPFLVLQPDDLSALGTAVGDYLTGAS